MPCISRTVPTETWSFPKTGKVLASRCCISFTDTLRDDAHAVGAKHKKTRQRVKKATKPPAPYYAVQPAYDGQLAQGHDILTAQPATLDVGLSHGFSLDDILARDDGNYGFALGDEESSNLMPADILDAANVDSWLNHLGTEAYDLPPLDSLDASATYLFNAAGAAELNELEPDLSPVDSISNVSDDIEATFDDADIPFLPAYNVEGPAGSSSVNDESPFTPTPVFAQPDFFGDATYNLDHEYQTRLLPPYHLITPDDNPFTNSNTATPEEDEHFQSMMTILDTAAAQIVEKGMGLDQLLSCVDTFSRGLKQMMPEKTALQTGTQHKGPEKKSLHIQLPTAETVDLTDDTFDEAFNALRTPTFSQILGMGEGVEV